MAAKRKFKEKKTPSPTFKNGKKKIYLSTKHDYHKPKEITLADGSKVMERYHNDYGSKPVYDQVRPDPEKTAKKPKDAASRHKYPPPKNNPVFRAKWMSFIDGVVSRSNFKGAHLEALEVLCDAYVEYDELSTFIRMNGRTYKSVSRFGDTIKPRPEVILLEKARSNIRIYSSQLDLFPKKDHAEDDPEGKEKSEWE